MVDWNLAVATADRLLRPGPSTSREQAEAVVAELREHAVAARRHVREFTRLSAPGDAPPALVIGRPAWVRANVDGFRAVLRPLTDKLRQRRAALPGGALIGVVGAKATGVEAGALLAFLGSRVLGQFETFSPDPAGHGRLLLVAPNIVQIERELGVDPTDFRLWVCLHEETHRLQFTAVPWLRDHLEGEVHAFLAETEVEPAALLRRLRAGIAEVGRGGQNGEPRPTSLVELVQSPAQREILARLTAVMSLLEGHAEYVMDGVGPQVVPTVADIREKFQARRAQGSGRLDGLLRRLLGMDAKMRQYRDGQRFVRAVVERVGMDGFNRVWTSPNTLPTRSEIVDPDRWVDRVHGRTPREG